MICELHLNCDISSITHHQWGYESRFNACFVAAAGFDQQRRFEAVNRFEKHLIQLIRNGSVLRSLLEVFGFNLIMWRMLYSPVEAEAELFPVGHIRASRSCRSRAERSSGDRWEMIDNKHDQNWSRSCCVIAGWTRLIGQAFARHPLKASYDVTHWRVFNHIIL